MFPGAPVPLAKKRIISRHPPSVNSLEVSGVIWRGSKLGLVADGDHKLEKGTEMTGLITEKVIKEYKCFIVLLKV